MVAKRKWRAFAAVVMSCVGLGIAKAQQETVLGGNGADAAQPAAWASQCVADARNGDPDCSVFHRVVAQTGQLVGSMTVRIAPGGEPVLVISAPLGLYLPAGISYSIDGAAPRVLEIQTCDQSGCFARQPVSSEILNEMFRGQKIDITFSNMERQAITLSFPLGGFSGAYLRIAR
jgi:invasion protein IalB